MSMLVEVERSMEAAATLADAVEEQISYAFVTRMQSVTWIFERFEAFSPRRRRVMLCPCWTLTPTSMTS